MRRRHFIAATGGAILAAPAAGRAQQPERQRRLGVLMVMSSDDPEGQARIAALRQELGRLGWTDGRNLRIDIRWAGGDHERVHAAAAALLGGGPDVILANGSTAVGPLLRATRRVPIVFVVVPDPVGAGFVASLARPGGNATGFAQFDYAIGAKWLELLTQFAPGIRRVAVLRDPATSAGIGQFGAIQSAAASVGVEVSPINLGEAAEIERAVAALAATSKGGLVATGSALTVVHRDLIIALAARHKLPAIYFARYFAVAGGLVAYGPDLVDQYRQAAGYIDRILKGETPAELPVQNPTRYELTINLKTAAALGLTVPPSLLARADEVIE